MLYNTDFWKIRFGQIFKVFLSQNEKLLQDHFYFLPDDVNIGPSSDELIKEIDLNIKIENYEDNFSEISDIPIELTGTIISRLNSIFVIIPGFGHHLLKNRAFEEETRHLRDIGFEFFYAFYNDSFESNEKCAKRVCDCIRNNIDDDKNLILIGYSKGAPVAIELLRNLDYYDIARRTKALVSIAGTIHGSPHASTKVTCSIQKLLKAYRIFYNKLRIGTFLKNFADLLSSLPIPIAREWNNILTKVAEIADELTDLPKGISQMTRVFNETTYADIKLPHHIKLFSISAIYPESEFEEGLKYISNPDDLFLYIAGQELYKKHLLNDTQVVFSDSRFWNEMGDVIDLGIVKADHWGIALPKVFSRHYRDPFPRTEFLKSLIILLYEYFKDDKV